MQQTKHNASYTRSTVTGWVFYERIQLIWRDSKTFSSTGKERETDAKQKVKSKYELISTVSHIRVFVYLASGLSVVYQKTMLKSLPFLSIL